MCIKVISHGGLIHDVRPTILHPRNESLAWVNPYETPKECKCGQNEGIASILKCDLHDCCRRTERLIPCALAGTKKEGICMVEVYHTYEARQPKHDEDEDDYIWEEDASTSWPPLPILDALPAEASPFAPPNTWRPRPHTKGFISYREKFLRLAKVLITAEVWLREAEKELDEAEAAYFAEDEETSLSRYTLQIHEFKEGRRYAHACDGFDLAFDERAQLHNDLERADQVLQLFGEGGIRGFDAWEHRD